MTHLLPLYAEFILCTYQIKLKTGAFVWKKNHSKENRASMDVLVGIIRFVSGFRTTLPMDLVGSGRQASFVYGMLHTHHPPWLAQRDDQCQNQLHPQR